MPLAENRITLNRYWDFAIEQSEDHQKPNLHACLAEFRSALQEAVNLELISDVPVGVLLSGGLDSSSIAAMLKVLNISNIQTFSVAFEDLSFDESKYARLMARQFGL